MKKITRLSLIILISLACKKDNRCETWTWYDECIPKSNLVHCNNPSPPNFITHELCGNALNGIYNGAAITVHEDNDAKIVRHYSK